MTIEETIINELENFNDKIAQILDQKKITDTGQAKKSLKVVVSENKVESRGVDYLEFLNRGSRPWDDKSISSVRKLGFILQITGWAKRRGVNPYAAANVIVTTGSRIHKNKSLGIQIDGLVQEVRNNLRESIPKAAKFEIQLKLNKFTEAFKARSI